MIATKTTLKERMKEVIDEWQTFSDLTINKGITGKDRRLLFNLYLRIKGNRKKELRV